MQAIISRLDQNTSKIVRNLWGKLYDECGLNAIYTIPTPHVTWFAADEIDLDLSLPLLSEIAEGSMAFTLHTFGLGIFSGEKPVLYLPMVKTLEMIHLHCKIWEQLESHAKAKKLYYSPKMWVPHITLALKDLTRENMACAVNAIGFDPIELYVVIDNLIVAEYEETSLGEILFQYDFNAK
jgi:2'-5' RNA ligase